MGSFLIKLNTGPPKTHPSKFFAALPNLSIRAKSYANQCKLFKPTVDLLILLISHSPLYDHSFLLSLQRIKIGENLISPRKGEEMREDEPFGVFYNVYWSPTRCYLVLKNKRKGT